MRKRFLQLAMAALMAVPSFYASAEITGTGTSSDPYLIGTAEDLCNAYTKIKPGGEVYFKQTADIDMDGVKRYTAINGFNGIYDAEFNYDGDYHVIKNFAPEDRAAGSDNGSYCTSIFGVLSGQVQHLGVVNANIKTAQGAGILAAYLGHGDSPSKYAAIDACFVQGTVECTGGYAGGFAGTTPGKGVACYITNSFAQVDVKASKIGAGIVGRLQADNTMIGGAYFAGTVTAAEPYGLLFAGSSAGASVIVSGTIYGFGNGPWAPEAIVTASKNAKVVIAEPYDSATIAAVQALAPYRNKENMFNGYPAFTWDMFAPLGSKANPYKIATAEDLCNAYKLVKPNGAMTYFVQTADIDMAGVESYTPFVGYDGSTYNRFLNYDGQNHVIRNFAPTKDVWDTSDIYNYGQSVFGVFSGELKNLGIVDMAIGADGGRAGGISGYLGHSSYTTAYPDVPTKVSNVYVTGKVTKGSSNYTGGMFGTTGGAVVLENCYVNVEMEGATGGLNGAFAGRLNNPTTIKNCYVAGTVSGNANLVCAANTGDVTVDGFVLFNTGSETTGLVKSTGEVTMANTEATKAAGIALVQTWPAFNEKKMDKGYPVFNWQEGSAVEVIFNDEVIDENAPVEYYNLSGVRVANPTPGIYVKKQGNKVTKVIVR